MFSAELNKSTVMAVLRQLKGRQTGEGKSLKKAASQLNRGLIAWERT